MVLDLTLVARLSCTTDAAAASRLPRIAGRNAVSSNARIADQQDTIRERTYQFSDMRYTEM
jgi:hypothetical protein